MDEYDYYPNVKVHLVKDLKEKFLLKGNGKWNIYCGSFPSSGHIKANTNRDIATCQRCINLYDKTHKKT